MFSAMVKKEFLLVFRDKHALLALFVMPAVFILIMSVALRDQFISEKINFSIYLQNHDNTEISKQLTDKLKQDPNFILTKTKKDAEFTIIIPKDFKKDNKKLSVIVSNGIKNDLLEIFKSKLLKSLVALKIKSVADELAPMSSEAAQAVNSITLSYDSLFDVKYEKNQKIPNSTQQSVPTWIVFGMFFVIIPMSTIYINERKQNTLTRLTSMNISVISMTFSKIIPYLLINHIQVWIMLSVGIFIVPLFNTPALEINGDISALIFLSLSLSLSAIGLSTLIAVSANSSEQATTIGGILNILLGAIGGVMVPKFIMPESMQSFADISPMSWGLDGFLEIFLKSADIWMVLNESGMLLLFGMVCLIASMIILKTRISKGL
ncbi:ABC transporter permease [Sulfurimonas lithotrophica]|uniref:ABC transporter permease n=1 Tax=Sulfurimonas lithotrophica TaxID=2590022 RepID=A0A5P8P3C6_9BACT|nr:ABC transporter permease [Sulfurimonas lithotrophica]QFR50194.1 ABC transporter permease [Sulfurimonas lithotrophica]